MAHCQGVTAPPITLRSDLLGPPSQRRQAYLGMETLRRAVATNHRISGKGSDEELAEHMAEVLSGFGGVLLGKDPDPNYMHQPGYQPGA